MSELSHDGAAVPADTVLTQDPLGDIENPDELPLLVLASASPGRAKILKDAGIDFDIQVSRVDEHAALAAATERFGELGPADTALLLAKTKAEDVASLEATDGAMVLGCDSVFEFEGVAYGKPYTPEVATERWEAMSGKSGILHTGHWLIDNRSEEDDDGGSGATIGAVSSTVVNFEKVSAEEIAAYVATGEPLPCAGGFTIDGRGAAFIRGVEGNPHTVVGLNVSTLRELLHEAGLSITDIWA
ncbi:septum formation inhibitor Maf [Arthrobacter sp. MYb227]|uniref:Maf family protein n=1 Tax=Arthrobacter sp. MYb227 TaxID=1848601 RepID=UPI000CFE27BF|nr:nucleoside triphosphate pyrophosphatase [Arthrobacter sp. MYb227]PQZ91127.1 septum formation inhibitor Maf [Arthrobacter sp. MYb227]